MACDNSINNITITLIRLAISYVRAGNLLGAKLGTASVVGELGTTAVVATRAGALVSACTGLGAGGVTVGPLVAACTRLRAGRITVGTASVLPGTATEGLLAFTASKTACTMLGTSWVVKGRVTGGSVEDNDLLNFAPYVLVFFFCSVVKRG